VGAAAGFIGGVLFDSVTYTPYGMNAALLGLIGYALILLLSVTWWPLLGVL
jgi:cell shape-determining protein MreD